MRHRASLVLIKEGAVLLVKRRRESRDYYICVGGGVEEGETAEEALVREVREEAGIEVKVIQKLQEYTYEEENRGTFFLCEQIDSNLPVWQELHKQTKSNSYALEWVSSEKLLTVEIVPPIARNLLTELLQKISN